MDLIKRRTFLKLIQGGLVMGLIPSPAFSMAIAPNFSSFFIFNKKGQKYLQILDQSNRTSKTIQLPAQFNPHYFTPNPLKKNVYGSVDAWGPHVLLMDFSSGSIIKSIQMKSHEEFGGHMLFSKDGREIYASLNDLESKQGFLLVLDSETLKETGRLPTQGFSPHDMKLIDGGRKLLMINSGINREGNISSKSNVCLFNLKEKKLEKTFNLNDSHVHLGHMTELNQDEFVLVGARLKNSKNKSLHQNVLPFVTKLNLKTGLKDFPMSTSAGTCNQLLLSAITSKKLNLLAVTSPDEGKIYFWDLKKLQPLREVHIPAAVAISFSTDQKILNVGSRSKGMYQILMNDFSTKKILEKEVIGYDSHSTILENYRKELY